MSSEVNEPLRCLVLDPGRELDALTRRLTRDGAAVVATTDDAAKIAPKITSFRPHIVIARHRFRDQPADDDHLLRAIQQAEVRPLLVLWGDRAFGQEWQNYGDHDCLILDGMSEPQVAANLAIILRLAKAAPGAAGPGRENQRLRRRLDHALKLVGDAEARFRSTPGDAPEKRPETRDRVSHLMHELRTPLNVIQGYAEILKMELLGPLGHEHYRDHATTIHETASHMLNLVNRYLDVARLEADPDDLHVNDVQVASVIASLERMFADQAAKKGVNLVTLADDDLPVVRTDETKLRQVLVNLVSNAINFTPRGGRVSIVARTESEGRVAVLVVSDTGVGMKPDDLARAMQPWGRIEDRVLEGGSGLGLSIVDRIVQRLGGTLELRSQADVGTTAIIRLPIAGPPT